MHEVHTFPINPIERFASSSAAIKRPTQLAHFSYTANATLPNNAPSSTNLLSPTESTASEDTQIEPTYPAGHSRVRQLHHDARGLKYYYGPEVGVSLSEGFDTFQQVQDADDEHLDGLLASLTHLEQERAVKRGKHSTNGEQVEADVVGGSDDHIILDGENAIEDWKVQTDIVTWRGMITKIMAAPYSNFDGFEMNATVFDGTIFIEESHEAKLSNRAEQNNQRPRHGQASQEMMSYWGHKFETLSLLPHKWDETSREFIESRPQHITNNFEQYISVVQTGIGDLKMILGGEVDAVWDFLPSDPSTTRPTYVELKTAADHELLTPSTVFASHPHLRMSGTEQPRILNASTMPTHSPQQRAALERFDRKLLKFWIQSFLLGVPKIIVGFRTNDVQGILTRVQDYETAALPRMVKERAMSVGRKPPWEREVCVNFTGSFLGFLKNVIEKEGKRSDEGKLDGGTWKIRRRDKSAVIEVFKVEESGFGDILSREFVAWRKTGDPVAAAKEGALERLRGSIWAGGDG